MTKKIPQDSDKSQPSVTVPNQGLEPDSQWNLVVEPIRPSIKLLLLIPLGFGISMVWESLGMNNQQPIDLDSVVMEGFVVSLVFAGFVVLPVYLIVGNQVRKYMRPIVTYFLRRWKYLIFGLFGVTLLDFFGLFSSIESVVSGAGDSMSPILQFGIGLTLVIVLSEVSVQVGKLLFLIFGAGRK